MSKANPLWLACLLLFCVLISTAPHSFAAENEDSVTIRKNQTQLVEQYRANGFVYAVKVTPENGQPYYLVRADGSQGDFIRTDQPDMLVPSWLILSW